MKKQLYVFPPLSDSLSLNNFTERALRWTNRIAALGIIAAVIYFSVRLLLAR